MKKNIYLAVLLCFPIIAFTQPENKWKTFYDRAIAFYDHGNHYAAEQQFRAAQRMLLAESGLTSETKPTYFQILYRRAHNLFLIDSLTDTSFVCFQELYNLSKESPEIDSSHVLRMESALMLSILYYEKELIRSGCELLENEKKYLDNLPPTTDLFLKYQYYFYLAKFYDHILVALLHDTGVGLGYLNSPEVIVRDAGFYEEYISVYKELANLSEQVNKGDVKKHMEVLISLADHCGIPDDDNLARLTFDRAFSLWGNDKHDDITYLKLCKSFLSYCNRTIVEPPSKQCIASEFDSIIHKEEDSLSYIDLMDFYSALLQDKSLSDEKKESIVKKICDELATVNNIAIAYYIVYEKGNATKQKIKANKNKLIRFFSLCAIHNYEKGNTLYADLLLNKAKFFSLTSYVEQRLLYDELNEAIARSAKYIGDEDTYHSYKSVVISSKVAKGLIPSAEDMLIQCGHGKLGDRISQLETWSNVYVEDEMYGDFCIALGNAYLEGGNIEMAEIQYKKIDSIITWKSQLKEPIPLVSCAEKS